VVEERLAGVGPEVEIDGARREVRVPGDPVVAALRHVELREGAELPDRLPALDLGVGDVAVLELHRDRLSPADRLDAEGDHRGVVLDLGGGAVDAVEDGHLALGQVHGSALRQRDPPVVVGVVAEPEAEDEAEGHQQENGRDSSLEPEHYPLDIGRSGRESKR